SPRYDRVGRARTLTVVRLGHTVTDVSGCRDTRSDLISTHRRPSRRLVQFRNLVDPHGPALLTRDPLQFPEVLFRRLPGVTLGDSTVVLRCGRPESLPPCCCGGSRISHGGHEPHGLGGYGPQGGRPSV